MKKLFIIGGTMGVGKTAVCRYLKVLLNNSVFLDGDWCWDADPFQITEETKQMAVDNICHLLNNFIHCSVYENVIFCWVMHRQSIVDDILKNIDTESCTHKEISLVCDEFSLKERLQKDVDNGIRSADVIEKSLARIPMYLDLNTIKIDTTNKSIEEIAREIISI